MYVGFSNSIHGIGPRGYRFNIQNSLVPLQVYLNTSVDGLAMRTSLFLYSAHVPFHGLFCSSIFADQGNRTIDRLCRRRRLVP